MFIVTINGQVVGTCVPFNSSIQLLSQCQSLINYNVFVPENSSIASLDAIAAQKTGAFRLGLTSVDCTENAMQFICSEVFRSCTSLPGPNSTTISIPSQTCKRRCDHFVDSCTDNLIEFGSEIPDCNRINSITNGPDFPEWNSNIPLPSGIILSIPCNNPDSGSNSQWAEIPRATCLESLQPNDTPLSKCNTVIDYPVYIPDFITLSEIDSRASTSNALARTNSVSRGCSDDMMRFVCAEAFRKCNYVSVDTTLPDVLLPSSTCYDNCINFNQGCSRELQTLSDEGKITYTPTFCDQIDPNTNQPIYPEEVTSYYFAAANITKEVPCQYPDINGDYYLPRCEKFMGYPAECRFVVDWPVLIPPNTTQLQLIDTAIESLARSQAAPTSCREKALRLTCATVFLKCNRYDITPAVGVNLPSFVCKSLCTSTVDTCDSDIDCDALTETGLELYPIEGTDNVVQGSNYFVPCHIPDYVNNQYPKVNSCPHPLTLTDDDEDVCAFKCPRPVFTFEEYLGKLIVAGILSYLGIITGTIAFLSLSLHPLKRTFPKNIINFQILAATLMVINFVFDHWVYGSGPPYRNVWCDNSYETATGQSNGACAVESFFLYTFNLSLVMWYAVVAIFMVRAVLGIRIPDKLKIPLQLTLHGICWGIPILLWVILMATDQIASQGTFPCFANADTWNKQLVEVVFWYPITVLLVLGLILTAFSVVYTMIKLGRKGIKTQFRLILYLAYNFCANMWIVFYHYYVIGRRDDFESAAADWAECSATSVDGCDLEGGIEYWLYIIQAIVYSSQPLCLALILLIDIELWYWWRDIFRRYILRRDIDDRIEVIKRAKQVQIEMDKGRKSSSKDNLILSDESWGADN